MMVVVMMWPNQRQNDRRRGGEGQLVAALPPTTLILAPFPPSCLLVSPVPFTELKSHQSHLHLAPLPLLPFRYRPLPALPLNYSLLRLLSAVVLTLSRCIENCLQWLKAARSWSEIEALAPLKRGKHLLTLEHAHILLRTHGCWKNSLEGNRPSRF